MKLNNYIRLFREKIILSFGKNKKLFILLIILVVSICLSLVFFPSGTSSKKIDSVDKVSSNNKTDYSSLVENKIRDMLLNLSEVTKADVMVVCESTEIYEYLKNTDETRNENNATKHEEVAYQKDGSNTSPIIVTSKNPKILGVWIIINSVSASTKLAITNSIESVLNVDKECISILQER